VIICTQCPHESPMEWVKSPTLKSDQL